MRFLSQKNYIVSFNTIKRRMQNDWPSYKKNNNKQTKNKTQFWWWLAVPLKVDH